MVVTKSPESYKETALYKEFCARDNAKLQSKVETFIETITPLLNITNAGPFKDYTLHNNQHSKKLLHLAGFIIPDSLLHQLSDLELTIMIMSFYLHDVGMVITDVERRKIIESPDFISYLRRKGYAERLESINNTDYLPESKDLLKAQILDVAVASYIRPDHAKVERYKKIIELLIESSHMPDMFESGQVSFADELINICYSHNEKTVELLAMMPGSINYKYPIDQIIDGYVVNSQFLAAVLRLTDVLDFDRERTPKSLFNALAIEKKNLPGFEVSLREWNKQLSVHSIDITTHTLRIIADSENPSIERAIRDYCSFMEREIRDTLSILSRNGSSQGTKSYQINLPMIVEAVVRSKNYTFKDFSIRLNDQKIIELLMGENLYSHLFTAARELIQNSIDACSLKESLDDNYTSSICIKFLQDEDRRLWMSVSDNGIGMDNYVLENFFFRIGSSYYTSHEFKEYYSKKRIRKFVPISRFGIGILSVFMIGDYLKVVTCNTDSENDDFLQREIFLSDTKSLAVVREKQAERQGTTIEVRMKPYDGDSNDYVKRIIQYIKDTFIRPSIPINIEDLEHNVIVIKKGPYLQLKNEIYTDLEKTTAQVVSLDLNRFSQILDGRCFFIFFRKKNGELSYYDENNLYSWGRYPFKEERLFDARRVNLVTVNGIRMTAKKTGSLYNFRRHNVIMVVDVDISGSDRITYDVSRDKIIGQGLHFFRRELMNAIRDGLKSMGYYDQLDMETKEHFSKAALSKLPNPPLDKGLLESIYAEIPKSNEWIYGLHKTIADKLGVSANLVEKYIRALISMGRIPKPTKS